MHYFLHQQALSKTIDLPKASWAVSSHERVQKFMTEFQPTAMKRK
jgi:hypothetical protein